MALAAACGFTDMEETARTHDGAAPDATVPDGAVTPDEGAAPDAGCGEPFGKPERVSDLAPAGRYESSPAIARAADGTLWIVWVDAEGDGVPGALRAASAPPGEAFGPSREIAGCVAVGEPAIGALGDVPILAAVCADVGGRICAYSWNAESGAWAGPVPIDATGEGPARAWPRIASGAATARAMWTEDSTLVMVETTDAAAWTDLGVVSEPGHVVLTGAAAGEDPTWIAYSHRGGDVLLRRRDAAGVVTIAQEPAPAVVGIDLTASGAGVVLAWSDGSYAYTLRLPDGVTLYVEEVEPSVGAPRVAWDAGLHILLPHESSLTWLYVGDPSGPVLRPLAVPIAVAPAGPIALAVAGDLPHVVLATATDADVEVFRIEATCAP